MQVTQSLTLSADEMAAFERDGYYIARGMLSVDHVAEIRQAFMTMASDGPVEGLSEIQPYGKPYDPADPLSRYPRMMHPHLHLDKPVGLLARRYMLHPGIGQVLSQLMGEEALAVQSMFYFKPPGARGQDFHQDNYYLRVSPGTCMAAWMAIDDADPANGGMSVVPGTQRMEVGCPKQADSAVSFTSDHVDIPEGAEPVPAILKAGDVLFFNGSVIHGSTPNTSATRFRRALICHYVPQSTEQVSRHYRQPTRFDGTEVDIAEALGGGPCGNLQGAAAVH